MISFLRGIVFRSRSGIVEIDVHGVGYRVHVPDGLALRVVEGDNILVFTHHHIREDANLLFGFETEEERDWFELLLNVSGIGPKGALQIVSATDPASFFTAVSTEDITALCGLPGVGKKTAQRLILDLKDKVGTYATLNQSTDPVGVKRVQSYRYSIHTEAVEALKALGYNEKQAEQTVRTVVQNEQMSLEEALKLCLQSLDTFTPGRL